MNYPIQSLVVLGPILFILLLCGFAVIGVFAGWKRAAYWGGGNFLFYIIGMIIFLTAGPAIANAIAPMIASAIGQAKISASDLANITQSITGPVIFIITFAIGNLILLINYYAWFKRVVGIKKEAYIKKALRLAKKNKTEIVIDNNNPKIAKLKITEKDIAMVKTTKYKLINYLVGGVGLVALTVPSTIAFTQTTMYLTTSSSTRKANSFANGLYEGLNSLNKNVSWFSFYQGKDVGEDFDAFFSALHLSNMQIKYIDPITGQESTKNVVDALSDSISNGLNNVAKEIEQYTSGKASEEELIEIVGDFTISWNSIINQAGDDLSGLMNSGNLLSIVEKAIMPDETKEINNQTVEALTAGTVLETIIDGFSQGQVSWKGQTYQVEKIEKIEVSESSYNKFSEMIANNFNTEQLTEENKQAFNVAVNEIVGLLLIKK